MRPKIAGLCVVVAAVLITVHSSAFVLRESEQAFLIRFGQVEGDAVTSPGLHWKLPFVDEVRRFDRRLLLWAGDAEQVPTSGREFVLVATSARVRIVNPRLFLETVRDESGARSRLDDVLHAVVRGKISSSKMEEIIRSRTIDTGSSPAASRGIEDLEREIREEAGHEVATYGIELSDVRIKRVSYVPSVRQQVVNRMISERQSVAEKFRSEGRGKSQEILGEVQRELQTIRSEAQRKAVEIRGTADARVTRLYGEAYGRNPEFYGFLETLETQRETMGQNTTLMVRADSDFYRYLQSAGRGSR